jgi:hypothetical protein
MESLMLFALLPLGLASLFQRRLPCSTAHIFGLGLAALAKFAAPVVASGVSKLFGSKQKKNAEKQAEEQRKLEAQQADALAKQQWEAQMNSPEAQAARFKNTLRLGRLYGAMGGQDKVPPSIAKYYQSARTMPEYSGVSSYVPTAQKKGGGWDLAAGIADSLQYLDFEGMKNERAKNRGVLGGFGTGSSSGGPTPQTASAAPAGSLGAGLVTNRYNPFDPKFGQGQG